MPLNTGKVFHLKRFKTIQDCTLMRVEKAQRHEFRTLFLELLFLFVAFPEEEKAKDMENP